MRKDDIVRLRHMLDAAREARGFADLDIVWSTVTEDLPPLAKELDKVLSFTHQQ